MYIYIHLYVYIYIIHSKSAHLLSVSRDHSPHLHPSSSGMFTQSTRRPCSVGCDKVTARGGCARRLGNASDFHDDFTSANMVIS